MDAPSELHRCRVMCGHPQTTCHGISVMVYHIFHEYSWESYRFNFKRRERCNNRFLSSLNDTEIRYCRESRHKGTRESESWIRGIQDHGSCSCEQRWLIGVDSHRRQRTNLGKCWNKNVGSSNWKHVNGRSLGKEGREAISSNDNGGTVEPRLSDLTRAEGNCVGQNVG